MSNKNEIRKNQRAFYLVLASFFLVVVFMHPVSAHFVCGQVLNSPDNVSAAWLNVQVFYPQTPDKFATCQISPQGNKYCCDTEAKNSLGNYELGKAWAIGSVVSAEVYDPSAGFAAGPVSVATTGQGYDIFPEMQIKKVIKIYSPNRNLIFSNGTQVLLNASFLKPYNNVTLNNGTSNISLCSNCTSFSGTFNVSNGINKWEVFAQNGSQEFSSEVNFSVIGSLNFSRAFDCKKCRQGLNANSIPYGETINVTLMLNASSYLNGISLAEYVPSSFKILNSTGTVENYSSSDNEIVWNNLSGKSLIISYSVKSPDFKLISKDAICEKTYNFSAYIGGDEINSENVSMKKIFGFCEIKERAGKKNSYYNIYPFISPNNPYIIYNESNMKQIAFFPNSTMKNVRFQILNNIPSDKIKGALNYYEIVSNMNQSLLDRTYVYFGVNKSLFINPKDISLFSYDHGWKKQNVTYSGEDNKSFYFKGFVSGDVFAVVNSNSNIAANLLNPRNYISLQKVFGNSYSLSSSTGVDFSGLTGIGNLMHPSGILWKSFNSMLN